jgi:hypothetical protein
MAVSCSSVNGTPLRFSCLISMKRGFVRAASTHRSRNLLLEEYVFSMHQIGDLYKDIIVRESVKGRRGIGVHEQ